MKGREMKLLGSIITELRDDILLGTLTIFGYICAGGMGLAMIVAIFGGAFN